MGYIATIDYLYPEEETGVAWLKLTINTNHWQAFIQYLETCSLKEAILPGTYLHTTLKDGLKVEEPIGLEFDAQAAISQRTISTITDLLSNGLVDSVTLGTYGDKNLAKCSMEVSTYLEGLAPYLKDTAFIYTTEGYEVCAYEGYIIQDGKLVFCECDALDVLNKKMKAITKHW